MPSISDVANDILSRLDSINAHSAATETSTAQISTDTQVIRATTQQIQVELAVVNNNLVAGFSAVLQVQLAALQRLDHIVAQNDSVLCNLGHANDLLCRQLHRLDTLVELENKAVTLTAHLDAVLELVHGNEAMQVERRNDLAARIDKCCPPQRPDPEPCPEPCPIPRWNPKTPDVSGFKPELLPVGRPGNPG